MSDLRRRLAVSMATRLSPDHTREATLTERHTVCRLRFDRLTRLHAWLEFAGKLTTGLWCAFIATVVLGVDWRHVVESALNSGRPIKWAIVVVIVIPTLLFVAARSGIGYARWRVQRELWRRDVARLTAGTGG